jgi:hypothetical protein
MAVLGFDRYAREKNGAVRERDLLDGLCLVTLIEPSA